MISFLAMQPCPRLDGSLPTHELGCCRSLLFATAAPARDCHRHKPRCSSRAGTTLGQNPTGPRAPVSSAGSSQNPGAGQTTKPQPSLCHNCCADKDTHSVAGPPWNWQGEVQEWASCRGLLGCVGLWVVVVVWKTVAVVPKGFFGTIATVASFVGSASVQVLTTAARSAARSNPTLSIAADVNNLAHPVSHLHCAARPPAPCTCTCRPPPCCASVRPPCQCCPRPGGSCWLLPPPTLLWTSW